MNKENEEEMVSFDGDPFQHFFSPICTCCVHLKTVGSCDAFPDSFSIPPEIWLGERSHLIPYPGDHEIMYEVDSEVFPERAEEVMELQIRLQEEHELLGEEK